MNHGRSSLHVISKYGSDKKGENARGRDKDRIINPNRIGVKYSSIVFGEGGKKGNVSVLTSLLDKSYF